ncbi:MAG TPA: S6e family ribosomal protein, partial [Candidatus Nanoarchaeia archaeon]|nr:S6e family ribosomal protein [Candidatus Nanoarchaeia archaeon]
FSIRGASDFAGFPLRKDVEGPVRKKVLMGHGVGNRTGGNNLKFRKTVSGNAITPRTVQVNLMVTQYGTKALDDVLGKKEDAQPGQ